VAERQRKADGGDACSVQHGEEEESQLGRVGERLSRPVGQLGRLG
jgi:hypothetical protein